MRLAYSWDDGALEDQKLFDLHEKYEIPAKFFVPTRNREGRDVLTPIMIRNAESKYISFGGHTENHTYLTSIPIEKVDQEVLRNRQYLEDTLGHQILDFCLPGGKYNEEVLQIVFKHYKTIRTADTMNFRCTGNILKPSIHVYSRGRKSLLGNAVRHHSFVELAYIATHLTKSYFELIQKIIEFENRKKESTVMIWGHSWELEKYNLWDELENLLRITKEYGVVDYANIFQN